RAFHCKPIRPSRSTRDHRQSCSRNLSPDFSRKQSACFIDIPRANDRNATAGKQFKIPCAEQNRRRLLLQCLLQFRRILPVHSRHHPHSTRENALQFQREPRRAVEQPHNPFTIGNRNGQRLGELICSSSLQFGGSLQRRVLNSFLELIPLRERK